MMGGRGARSFTPSGRLVPLNFQKGALGTKVPEDLKEALGDKGSPYSIADSCANANPYFSEEYDEYSSNCQRCVVAYEMRRRGYDVTAMPTYAGDTKPNVAFSAEDGSISGRWMGAFQGAKAEYAGAKTKEGALTNLNSKVKQGGSGSRGVVQVFWDNGGGHVFNFENVGGKPRYFDAQTGKAVNIKTYIGQAKPGSVNYIRTDNLRPSNRMREFVTQTRK